MKFGSLDYSLLVGNPEVIHIAYGRHLAQLVGRRAAVAANRPCGLDDSLAESRVFADSEMPRQGV